MVFGRRRQLGARAVGAAKSRSRLGVVRSGWRPDRTSWLSRAAARSAALVATRGHGRCSGVVHRLRPHSFERVGHSGRWARLERRAEVTGIGRGGRRRRHRAAWRLVRHAVASSHRSSGAGFIRTCRSLRRVAENGRSASRVTVQVSPPLASPRAAPRVARTSCFSRTWSSPIFIRTAVQQANGAVAPDGPVLSCRRRRAAHLQRWVRKKDEDNEPRKTRTGSVDTRARRGGPWRTRRPAGRRRGRRRRVGTELPRRPGQPSVGGGERSGQCRKTKNDYPTGRSTRLARVVSCALAGERRRWADKRKPRNTNQLGGRTNRI